jgi:ABC-type bacteriocin/lantibiotic exporter with double-glycine peptidase domain
MRRYLSKVLYVLSAKLKKLIFMLVVFILASTLEAVGIGLIGPFLNIVSDPSIVRNQPVFSKLITSLNLRTDAEIIIGTGLFVIAIFCFKSLIYFFCRLYIYRFSYQQKKELESRLVHTYLHIPYLFHLNHNSANLIKNIVIESYQFAINCLIPLLEVVANLIMIIVLLLLLASTDPWLLAVAMGILLPIMLIFARMSRRIRGWGQIKSDTQEDMICTINHGLGGLKETKVIGCEAYFEAQLRQHSNAFEQAAILVDSFQLLPRVSIETVLVVFLLAFIVLSQLLMGRTLGDLTSIMGVFAVASIRLIPSASQMLNAIGRMRESSYALDMLYHDLKEIERFSGQSSLNHGSNNCTPFPSRFQYELSLDRITYRYPGAPEPAVQDFSLTIRKGESIALIGQSGSGKTTLVDIILGVLTPEQGEIRMDGVPIHQHLRAWQDLVGYIPQSIFLTDETIEQNIAFGVPPHQIDSERLWQAIQAAQLEDLIQELPQGVKTPVGERGIRLSGGQRQRIGIARALYHEREILVLDEATSALDSVTEQLVSQAIHALAGKKTLIIIAHRLSTIEGCDRIYRLHAGKLQQTGTFEEVILSGNETAHLR